MQRSSAAAACASVWTVVITLCIAGEGLLESPAAIGRHLAKGSLVGAAVAEACEGDAPGVTSLLQLDAARKLPSAEPAGAWPDEAPLRVGAAQQPNVSASANRTLLEKGIPTSQLAGARPNATPLRRGAAQQSNVSVSANRTLLEKVDHNRIQLQVDQSRERVQDVKAQDSATSQTAAANQTAGEVGVALSQAKANHTVGDASWEAGAVSSHAKANQTVGAAASSTAADAKAGDANWEAGAVASHAKANRTVGDATWEGDASSAAANAKATDVEESTEGPKKNKVILMIIEMVPLCGPLGLDRFYLGAIGTGVAKLIICVCTCLIGGLIWGVLDAMIVIINSLMRKPSIGTLGMEASFDEEQILPAFVLALIAVGLQVWVCCGGWRCFLDLYSYVRGRPKAAK